MKYLHNIGGHLGKKLLFLFILICIYKVVGVSSIQSTPSAVINEVYKNIFGTVTEYNRQAIIGLIINK
ncbi:10709_t:CDS:2 [Funneliformis mosseae]|uniref:10709_t:CDS:1 n=1 Tax=Funneliformis mosseae TaxID=27381 RepID=A0A9N9A731_FUNMO|nr:10709_t:CDS:2 [Funneliformis mosseae]